MVEGLLMVIILLAIIGLVIFLLAKVQFKRKNLKVLFVVSSALLICLCLLFSTYKLSKSRTMQLFGHIVDHVETNQKVVALTFDDGPTGAYTDEVIRMLEAYDAVGTFYLNGEGIEANMADAEAIIEAGHEVGNHTYSHPRLMLMSYNAIKDELEKTDALIRAAGYEGDITIRTPYCKKLIFAPLYFAKHERLNVTFSVEPQTYCKTADEMVAYVKQEVESGDIILLHVLNEANAEARTALPEILSYLTLEGYQLVTVSELLALAD